LKGGTPVGHPQALLLLPPLIHGWHLRLLPAQQQLLRCLPPPPPLLRLPRSFVLLPPVACTALHQAPGGNWGLPATPSSRQGGWDDWGQALPAVVEVALPYKAAAAAAAGAVRLVPCYTAQPDEPHLVMAPRMAPSL
jgi:hypothetical protein